MARLLPWLVNELFPRDLTLYDVNRAVQAVLSPSIVPDYDADSLSLTKTDIFNLFIQFDFQLRHIKFAEEVNLPFHRLSIGIPIERAVLVLVFVLHSICI